MLTKACLDLGLSADGILVEQHTKWRHIERQLCWFLCNENRRLVERVCVANFVVNVWVCWRDVGDNDLGFHNLACDVGDDKTRAIGFICSHGNETEFVADRDDDIAVEFVIGRRKLHDHKNFRALARHLVVRDSDVTAAQAPDTGLPAREGKLESGYKGVNAINRYCYAGASYQHSQVVLVARDQLGLVAGSRMGDPLAARPRTNGT